MGLFSREPAEKKAFDKAMIAMLNKPNEKTIAAMEAASDKWPTGWQGYLFIGLCYDLASCKMPFDPDKAAICHQKAKAAGKADGNKWLESFYETYEEEAGNYCLPESDSYFPRALNVRRVGAAMMQWHDLNKNNILPEKASKEDTDFWYQLICGIDFGPKGLFARKMNEEEVDASYQQTPFFNYIMACFQYKNGMKNDVADTIRDIIKPAQEAANTDPDNVTTATRDTSELVMGYIHLYGGGPAAECMEKVSRMSGLVWLWSAANRGCMPALHLIADLFDSQYEKDVCAAYAKNHASAGDRERVLKNLVLMLYRSAEKGDTAAERRRLALIGKNKQ